MRLSDLLLVENYMKGAYDLSLQLIHTFIVASL